MKMPKGLIPIETFAGDLKSEYSNSWATIEGQLITATGQMSQITFNDTAYPVKITLLHGGEVLCYPSDPVTVFVHPDVQGNMEKNRREAQARREAL